VAAAIGYDPESDPENTPDSIFCAHGAGFAVKWDSVFQHMHLPRVLAPPEAEETRARAKRYVELAATDKELMAIFERTYGPIPRTRLQPSRAPAHPTEVNIRRPPPERPNTLVGRYHIIFA
jgi:hypothetical protein